MASYLKPYDEPMIVRVVEGDVVILGPDGFSASITPHAAEESARRLLQAAQEARARRADDEA